MKYQSSTLQVIAFGMLVRNLLTPAFLALGAMLCIASQIEAAPIYSQVLPEEPVGAFSSQETVSGQKVADNFSLDSTGPVTIRSLRFVGGYSSFPPLDELPIMDGFRIVFLEDAGGNPGMVLPEGDFAVPSAFSRTSTNGRLLNGVRSPIEFVVDLGHGITLTPNTMYWISITNDPGPDHAWVWARASESFDPLLASTFGNVTTGSWNVGNSGGMWFELNDENIPEPKTATLLLAAMSVAAISRGRVSRLNRSVTQLLP